jgi:hypothetical protein
MEPEFRPEMFSILLEDVKCRYLALILREITDGGYLRFRLSL